MASKDFHRDSFDAATRLKLELYRGYTREWIPVFLNDPSRPQVHIYDFFAGPGKDRNDRPGSPLLILDEIDSYIDEHPETARLKIVLHFNDAKPSKIQQLQREIESRGMKYSYELKFTKLRFAEAFRLAEVSLRAVNTANLVVVDQCGVKEINEPVFQALTSCPKTDLLFFLSSDFVKRFITRPSFTKCFPRLSAEKIRLVESKGIHRALCEYYEQIVPRGTTYFLAPFSIKKEKSKNIHGVIFGSGSLFGLEKFRTVCWKLDPITGEANYNIDNDWDRESPQIPLFVELPKKRATFRQRLLEFIKRERPDNHSLNQFVLRNGFLPRHAHEILEELQNLGDLLVYDCEKGGVARKRSFYLGWQNYKKPVRVVFELKESILASE